MRPHELQDDVPNLFTAGRACLARGPASSSGARSAARAAMRKYLKDTITGGLRLGPLSVQWCSHDASGSDGTPGAAYLRSTVGCPAFSHLVGDPIAAPGVAPIGATAMGMNERIALAS